MKITEETTLAELSLYRAKLGAPFVTMMTHGDGLERHAVVQLPGYGVHSGYGATEAEALSEAFGKLEASIGQGLSIDNQAKPLPSVMAKRGTT